MIVNDISTLKINKLTQAQYDRELAAGRIDATALYLIPHEALTIADIGGLQAALDNILVVKADSSHNHSASNIISGTLDVARGGTGATAFTSGAALIGNGTGAITARAITDNQTLTHIAYNSNLMTTNTLAFWNGSYLPNGASNLIYCNRGAFGTIVTKNSEDYVPYSGGVGTVTAGLNVGSNGAYIYTESANPGNIYLRYTATSGAGYSYTNLASIMSSIAGKLSTSGGTVSGNLVSTKTFAALSSSDPQGTYYTANRIHCTNNSIFRISTTGNTEGIAIGENFRSSQDNVMNLGNGNYKWKQLYAGTTTINTSDRNSKEDFRTFDSNENYEKLFMDLKPLVFKFKDGDSGRDHFGFVSQDVEESLYKLGFNDKSFAGFCRDVLMYEVKDEDGNEKEVPKLDENGNEQYIYGLRYGEFTALNTYMIQKTIKENQELKDKNEKLEAKNEELETRLQAIERMLEKLDV